MFMTWQLLLVNWELDWLSFIKNHIPNRLWCCSGCSVYSSVVFGELTCLCVVILILSIELSIFLNLCVFNLSLVCTDLFFLNKWFCFKMRNKICLLYMPCLFHNYTNGSENLFDDYMKHICALLIVCWNINISE